MGQRAAEQAAHKTARARLICGRALGVGSTCARAKTCWTPTPPPLALPSPGTVSSRVCPVSRVPACLPRVPVSVSLSESVRPWCSCAFPGRATASLAKHLAWSTSLRTACAPEPSWSAACLPERGHAHGEHALRGPLAGVHALRGPLATCLRSCLLRVHQSGGDVMGCGAGCEQRQLAGPSTRQRTTRQRTTRQRSRHHRSTVPHPPGCRCALPAVRSLTTWCAKRRHNLRFVPPSSFPVFLVRGHGQSAREIARLVVFPLGNEATQRPL